MFFVFFFPLLLFCSPTLPALLKGFLAAFHLLINTPELLPCGSGWQSKISVLLYSRQAVTGILFIQLMLISLLIALENKTEETSVQRCSRHFTMECGESSLIKTCPPKILRKQIVYSVLVFFSSCY